MSQSVGVLAIAVIFLGCGGLNLEGAREIGSARYDCAENRCAVDIDFSSYSVPEGGTPASVTVFGYLGDQPDEIISKVGELEFFSRGPGRGPRIRANVVVNARRGYRVRVTVGDRTVWAERAT